MNLEKLKYFINQTKRDDFGKKDFYICTCDLEQHKYTELGNTGVKIEMNHRYNADHRWNHPRIGKIVYASEGAQFKVGQEIYCKHWVFENTEFESQEFYTQDDGTKLFAVDNFMIMFGIGENNEIIPREGVVICNPVFGNFFDSEFQLSAELSGRRRDIARVHQVWEGCQSLKIGEHLMLKMGGDYEFEWQGEKYIKVDVEYEDAFAIVEDEYWYDSELRKHVDHNNSTLIHGGVKS